MENKIDAVSESIRIKRRIIPLELNPFSHIHLKISDVQVIEIRSLPEKNGHGDIIIAYISLPSVISNTIEYEVEKTNITTHIDKEANTRNLIYYGEEESDVLLKAFKKSIIYAIEKCKANIICINELGLPLKILNTDTRMSQARLDALAFAKDKADTHKCLIFAGTTHDHRTFLNTAHIFYPGCQEYGICFHKQVSACDTTELISISPIRKSLILKAFGLRIGFLICLDIGDYSSVTPLVKLRDRIDILIIPTFSRKFEPLGDVAHFVCKAITGYAALINYYDKGTAGSHLYKFDEESTLELEKHKPEEDSNFEVNLHRLNLEELKNEKAQNTNKISPKIKWFFGLKKLDLITPS